MTQGVYLRALPVDSLPSRPVLPVVYIERSGGGGPPGSLIVYRYLVKQLVRTDGAVVGSLRRIFFLWRNTHTPLSKGLASTSLA